MSIHRMPCYDSASPENPSPNERERQMKRLFCAALATAFFALSTPVDSSAQGQGSVFFGGGATFPVSDFGELAKTGWQGWGGVLVPVSDAGISLGFEGFYGKNNHETDGNKTALWGGLALVGMEFGDPEALQPTVFGGLGFMRRSFSSEATPILDNGASSFAWGGGAGVGFPLGGVRGFAGGSYTSGTGDVNFGVRFVTLGVSVMIPIG